MKSEEDIHARQACMHENCSERRQIMIRLGERSLIRLYAY